MGALNTKKNKSYPLKVKLLLMGMPEVGKSSIINSFQGNDFNPKYEPTIGCKLITLNLSFKTIYYDILILDSLSDNDLELECRLKSIKNAEIIAIIFDLTNPSTWDDVQMKLRILKDNDYQNSHVLLIGNKCDEAMGITEEEIINFCKGFRDYHIDYIQTSAKAKENIEKAFIKAFELGYYAYKYRWDKVKIILFGNICEALPNLIKRKKTPIILNPLTPDIMKRLISYI